MPASTSVACIVYRHEACDSFARLSDAAVDALGLGATRATLRLSWVSSGSTDRTAFVLFNGAVAESTELKHPAIELSSAFSNLNDIDAGIVVTVSICEPCEIALSVTASAQTTSDWTLLNAHAQAVQDSLLSQCAVVFPGMLLPLWLDPPRAGYVVLRVSSARACAQGPEVSPALLRQESEVEIQPPSSAPPALRRQQPISSSETAVVRATILSQQVGAWVSCQLDTRSYDRGSSAASGARIPARLFSQLVTASAGHAPGAPLPTSAYISLAEERLVVLLRATPPTPLAKNALEGCTAAILESIEENSTFVSDSAISLSCGALESLCATVLADAFQGIPAAQRALLQLQASGGGPCIIWVSLQQICGLCDPTHSGEVGAAPTLSDSADWKKDEESRLNAAAIAAVASARIIAEGATLALPSCRSGRSMSVARVCRPANTVAPSAAEISDVDNSKGVGVSPAVFRYVTHTASGAWYELGRVDCFPEAASRRSELRVPRLAGDILPIPSSTALSVSRVQWTDDRALSGLLLVGSRIGVPRSDAPASQFATLLSRIVACVVQSSPSAAAPDDDDTRLNDGGLLRRVSEDAVSATTRYQVLIAGAPGSGRTHALLCVADHAIRCGIHAEILDCGHLVSLPLAVACEGLVAAWLACWLRPRAVLLLDNLDILAPHTGVGEEGGSDAVSAADEQTDARSETAAAILAALMTRGSAVAQRFFSRRWHYSESSRHPSQPLSSVSETCAAFLKALAVASSSSAVEGRQIPCIVSARSATNLHLSLRSPGMFDAVVKLQALSAHDDRVELLRALVRRWPAREASGAVVSGYHFDVGVGMPWAELVAACDGWTPADLARGVNAAWSAAAADACSNELHATIPDGVNVQPRRCTLMPEQLRTALEAAVPGSVATAANASRAAGGEEAAAAAWDDLGGGLEKARQAIEDVILLPSRYPSAFVDVPVRLPKGILLYGAPGCGKSALAEVAAAHCRVRLVRVRGPELLNKYIGESEAAVRAAFQRAAAAAPCILLLDGLDAIAPRRGAGGPGGSSGVTDRVVNQLLSVMDGVEASAMQGVFVVATTSRPDLVDPALLRAGRLDLAVLCPVPGPAERADILARLARRVPALRPEAARLLPLLGVCEECDGCTGADLRSLLSTANIEATRDAVELGSANDRGTCSRLSIDVKHVEAALRGLRPSLSRQDRAFYATLYDEFSGTRGGSVTRPDAPHERFGRRLAQA